MKKLFTLALLLSAFTMTVEAKTVESSKTETLVITETAQKTEKVGGFKAGLNKLKDKSIEKSKVLAQVTTKAISEKTSELKSDFNKGLDKSVKVKSALQSAWNEN